VCILLKPVFPKAAELAKDPETKEGVIYQISFPMALLASCMNIPFLLKVIRQTYRLKNIHAGLEE
jgi:hypothetical protein